MHRLGMSGILLPEACCREKRTSIILLHGLVANISALFARCHALILVVMLKESVEERFCLSPNLGKAELARVSSANLHGNSERKSDLTQMFCLMQ